MTGRPKAHGDNCRCSVVQYPETLHYCPYNDTGDRADYLRRLSALKPYLGLAFMAASRGDTMEEIHCNGLANLAARRMKREAGPGSTKNE